MIRIVLVDDDELTRAGLCSLLEASDQIEVVGHTGAGRRATELVAHYRPDIVVTEFRGADLDGDRLIRLIRRDLPSAGIVVYTTEVSEDRLYRAFAAGALGFLQKGRPLKDLLEGIAAVHAGQVALSPSAIRCVTTRFLQFDRARMQSALTKVESLSGREYEVLRCIAQGLGNAQIARVLYMSEGSVKSHVTQVLAKLECSNRVQAAIIAHDSGAFSAPASSVLGPDHPPLEAAS